MQTIIPTTHHYQQMADIYNDAILPFLKIYSHDESLVFTLSETETSIALQCAEKECLAITDNSKILGYAIFRQKNEDCFWISSLYVSPNVQQSGIGTLLLKEVENIAQDRKAKIIAVETHEKANWAIKFYLKNGFVSILEKFTHPPYSSVLSQMPVNNRPILGKLITL